MTYYKDMSSNYGFQPTLSGLNTIESDSTTSSDIICDTIQINQSGTAPTMTPNDNSTHIATTAYVDSAISGSDFVTLSGTQTISGQKTFTAANTYVTGNLVTNSIQADNPVNNINIGTQLTTGDVNIGTTASTGQNVALNWGTSSNSGQLTFRGGSFTLSSTGNYTQQSAGSLTTSIDTNKTTGVFNMLTGTTWSGNCNIGTGVGASGNIIIGGSLTKTYLSGTNTINVIKGQYIDLFAGQLRMFQTSTGGSAFTMYQDPGSGKLYFDAGSTNCDMIGAFNLTSNNMTCSIAPTTGTQYCNKTYVDSVSNYTNLLSSNNTWTAPNTFDDIVTNNLQVTNNDVVSFQNGAFFDNVCPYSTVSASGAQDLVTKNFTETSTQTITGAKTFQNIAINQLSGNVDLSFNSNTQRFRIRRPTNSIDFNVATNVSINTTSTTGSLQINAGVAPNIGGLTIQPTGGLGEGAEIDMQAVTFFAGNVWIDSNAGLKSFSSNNIKHYNPTSYAYDPTTITWGTPSANTINGWTNAPTNTGDTYSGTASDTTTPANVGQIVLPAAGIWFIQVSVLITLNTGSDTITDRTIVVSDVGTTSTTPCTVGFAYRDPIDDGAGSAGNRQQINFSGIYHHVSSTGSKTLYINAIVITSGSRTVTVSGNYKFTRIG